MPDVQRQQLSWDGHRVLLAFSVSAAALFHMYTPMIQSPLSSDKKRRNVVEDRVQHLARQANMSPPKVKVHLSLPYTPTAGVLGIQAGPKSLKPKICLTLHRDAVTQLTISQLDCLLSHELGHLAMREKSHSEVFARSGRDERDLAKLWGHHEEYAADWFGAQLCGKENMISLLTSDMNNARHPDGNSTSNNRLHPLNTERVESLLLSNQTYIHFGTQIKNTNLSDVTNFAVGLFKDDGEFKHHQIAMIGILAYAVMKKYNFFQKAAPAVSTRFKT